MVFNKRSLCTLLINDPLLPTASCQTIKSQVDNSLMQYNKIMLTNDFILNILTTNGIVAYYKIFANYTKMK